MLGWRRNISYRRPEAWSCVSPSHVTCPGSTYLEDIEGEFAVELTEPGTAGWHVVRCICHFCTAAKLSPDPRGIHSSQFLH